MNKVYLALLTLIDYFYWSFVLALQKINVFIQIIMKSCGIGIKWLIFRFYLVYNLVFLDRNLNDYISGLCRERLTVQWRQNSISKLPQVGWFRWWRSSEGRTYYKIGKLWHSVKSNTEKKECDPARAIYLTRHGTQSQQRRRKKATSCCQLFLRCLPSDDRIKRRYLTDGRLLNSH